MKSSDIGKTKQFCVSHHNRRKVVFFFFTHQECDEWIYCQRKKLSNSMSWFMVKSEGEGSQKFAVFVNNYQFASIHSWMSEDEDSEVCRNREESGEKMRKMIKITSSAIIRRIILKFLKTQLENIYTRTLHDGRLPKLISPFGEIFSPTADGQRTSCLFLAAPIKSTVECSFSFLCDSLRLRQSFHRK